MIEGIGGNKNRGIATSNHTIVKEEAESSGGSGGTGALLETDGLANDGGKIGASGLVVIERKGGFDGEWDG